MTWTDRRAAYAVLPLFSMSLKGAALAAPLFFAGTAPAMPQSQTLPQTLQEVSFSDLRGWSGDNQLEALASLQRFCAKPDVLENVRSAPGYGYGNFEELCKALKRTAIGSAGEARRFLETRFAPYRITAPGFVTGYFEPEVAASRTPTDLYSVPLHKKPEGLETIIADNRSQDWPSHLSHGRNVNGRIEELPDRSDIMDGALNDEQLELVFLADPVDAYFIHVQGSARLRLTDGSVMRVGYAGKTGHPYTGIGRLLVRRGEGTPEDFTMQGLRAWLAEHPDQRDALFKENRSYIFFREVTESAPGEGPIGAAGLPLTPGRSLAIDPDHVPYGSLVFVEAEFKDYETSARSFSRLMVADDTGSAIKGAARGDIFVGSGNDAGAIAGRIRAKARFTVLVPKTGNFAPDPVTD